MSVGICQTHGLINYDDTKAKAKMSSYTKIDFKRDFVACVYQSL